MSSIVSDIISFENQIHQFFLNQKIGSLLKRSNIDKEKGISPVAVFRFLVALAFTGKNLSKILASVMVEIGKDENGVPVPAKIVFARDRRSKKWWLITWHNDANYR